MSSKLDREREFDEIFNKMVKGKKPEAEVVVGIGVNKKKKDLPQEENPEEMVEESSEETGKEPIEIDVNTLIDTIRNANSFEELKSKLEELLSK